MTSLILRPQNQYKKNSKPFGYLFKKLGTIVLKTNCIQDKTTEKQIAYKTKQPKNKLHTRQNNRKTNCIQDKTTEKQIAYKTKQPKNKLHTRQNNRKTNCIQDKTTEKQIAYKTKQPKNEIKSTSSLLKS